MNKTHIRIVLFLVAAIFAFYLYRKYRIAPDIEVLQLPLTNTDGKTVDPQTFRGKTLFVHYWATWCGECLQEMPTIESAYEQSDTNSVVFIMISDESPDKIERYLSQHNYHMKFLHLEGHLQDIGINTIPTTYVYDKSGAEIFSKVGGGTRWDDPAILTMLKSHMEK